jgi:site-specific recombinase XerD
MTQEATNKGPAERYIAWLREQEAPERTVKRRARLLWMLADALDGENRLLTVTGEEILQAVSARLAKYKDAALNWNADLNTFFGFLAREGLRGDNPLERDTGKKIEVKEGSGIRTRNAGPELDKLRDEAILALLRETDIYPGELCLLTVGRYDRILARLIPEPGRCVLLNRFAAERLEEYLDALGSRARLKANTPLFIQLDRGAALPESHYWGLIRQDMRLAGTALPALTHTAMSHY